LLFPFCQGVIVNPPRIAITDAFSVANTLAVRLREGGASLIHVLSAPDIPPFFTRSFRADNFDRDLGYIADTDILVDELVRWGVDRVIPGSESGVLLADLLTERLKIPGNQPGSSAAWRDKSLMGERVAAVGLATAAGRAFTCVEEAVTWFAEAGLAEAVVKPVNSAGTDNVWFCQDVPSVEAACRSVLSRSNVYGEQNRKVLIQERLRGVEYYVNSVSHEGVHRAPEIWRYIKRPGATGSPVYDYEETVPARGAEAATLRQFTYAVLDALGVTSSAAHTEIMLTGQGPVLIETGARLGGATIPHIVEKYSGVCQAGLYAAALLDPQRLAEFEDQEVHWSATVRLVSLINRIPGEVRSLDWVARLEALPSVVAAVTSAAAGTWLDATTFLANSPGYVYLAAQDPAEVERDYAAIRALEEQGLFTSGS
jgi:biotin carboxylase